MTRTGRRALAGIVASVVAASLLGPLAAVRADAGPAPATSASVRTELATASGTVTGSLSADGTVPAAVTVAGSHVVASVIGSTFDISPAGGVFVPGSSLAAEVDLAHLAGKVTPVPGDRTVVLVHSGLQPLCPSSGIESGRLDIDAATYQDGSLTSLTGALALKCHVGSSGPVIDLRLNSTVPAQRATLSAVSVAGLAPGDSSSRSILVVNRGTGPLPLGAIDTTVTSAGWSVTVDAGTCGSSVPPGSGCSLHAVVVAGAGALHASYRIATEGSGAPYVDGVLESSPQVAQPVLRVIDAADGAALSWTLPDYALYEPSEYVVHRVIGAGAGTDLATTGRGRYADTDLAPGERATYTLTASSGSAFLPVDTEPVAGGRLAEDPDRDASVDVTATGSATDSVMNGGLSGFVTYFFPNLPAVPGHYSDTGPYLLSWPGCAAPNWTLDVADVAYRADGTIDRVAADGEVHCYGKPVWRIRTRYGSDPDPSGVLTGSAQPTVVTGPTHDKEQWVQVRFTNAGTRDLPFSASLLRSGAPAGVAKLQNSDCGHSLAPGATCFEEVLVDDVATWKGTLAVVVPGPGLFGDLQIPIDVDIVPDHTAPVMKVQKLPLFVVGPRPLTPSMTYADAVNGSGARSSYFRFSVAGAASPFVGWDYSRGEDYRHPPTGYQMVMTAGREYCVEHQASDYFDNYSAWSAMQCTSAVVGDQALRPDTHWKVRHVAATSATDGRYVVSSRAGATLTGRQVQARRVAVVVTTGPGCGRLAVYVGSTRVGIISTSSKTWRHEVLKLLPRSARLLTGRLTLRVLDDRRPVYVDAYGTRRR